MDKLTERSWPRRLVKSVDCRKRDLVIRIADWTRQSPRTGEPAYDVEVYDKGVYDWNLSQTFTTASSKRTKGEARKLAIAFACKQIQERIKWIAR